MRRWRHEYDWRSTEERLNRYDQFTARIEGDTVHFVLVRGAHPERPPVVLTHGWPYSFASMLPVLEALDGRLDVVVPSLPGYVFSEPMSEPFGSRTVARRWRTLMTDVLGYERFLVYGEDVGAPVSDWLAGEHPDAVAGIVATHASFSAADRPGLGLSDAETAFLASVNDRGESGYALQQSTRPDTLAAALTDSPSGLLAWIAEKLAAWSDGEGLDAFAIDDVLTNVMLYWVTGSIGTSFRSYSQPGPGDDQHPLVTVPASVLVQTHEGAYPRSLAEKSYLDLRRFDRLERGGHFTAWEAPQAVADAILDLEADIRRG
ncbi:epoxide hydrolase [Glycomyces albus]